MPARLMTASSLVLVLAVGNCGGEPPATEGRVSSVADDQVCVATDGEDLCFDPTEVDGADGLAVDTCVSVLRKLESGRPYEVEDIPC